MAGRPGAVSVSELDPGIKKAPQSFDCEAFFMFVCSSEQLEGLGVATKSEAGCIES